MSTGREAQMQLVHDYVVKMRGLIDTALPPGAVVPRHTDAGHFYGVPNGGVYPSVTGVIGYVKDPSIQQFDMNEALRYVETHIHTSFVDGQVDYMKVMDVLYEAKKAPKGILTDAGDIGTKIHDRREEYFQDWIDSGSRPAIGDYYKETDDIRLISGMRALSSFCDDSEYIPIRTEVMVYSDKYQIAGMLDDVGMVNTVLRKGDRNCQHELWYEGMKTRCDKCDYKRKWQFCLTDLKSSNQFKDSYYFQVALYIMMFTDLVKVKPERSFILKVSKEDGRYSTEELTQIPQLVAGAKKVIAAAEAVEKIKQLRNKSNAKQVIAI